MDQAAGGSRASCNAQPNFIKPTESLASASQDGRGSRESTTFQDPQTAYPPSSDPTATSSLSNDAMSMKADPGLDETSPHLHKIKKDGLGPGGDTSGCSETKMAAAIEPIDVAMAEIDKAVKVECMQWTHVFMESEQFEMLSSDHLDKLLQDAKALEENLIQQKERMLSHLKLLSQTLKLP